MPPTPGNPSAEKPNVPQQIPIYNDLRPAYYDDFHCLAAGCNWSCCKYWAITFSKKDYLSLKRQNGTPDLNARMEHGLRRIRKGSGGEKLYGEFNMDSGACPLLREDCLCSLQVEKGHGALPDVCRTYPRSETYLPSGYLERALSLSCEGVLSLLWDLPDGIEFRSDPLPKGKRMQWAVSGKNLLPLWFSVVREWCVDLLQNRRFSLPERIWIMGLGLRELADGGTDIERWMERAAALPDTVNPGGILPEGNTELGLFLSNCLRILSPIYAPSGGGGLLWWVDQRDPVSQEVWQSVRDSMGLQGSLSQLTIPLKPYLDARALYNERFRERDYFMENVMVSVFFHQHMPKMDSVEELWKSYVNFCNLYGIYRFMSVMSCRGGAAGDRAELFRMIVCASRAFLHNANRRTSLRDEYFQNDSATLAHMAILLCG